MGNIVYLLKNKWRCRFAHARPSLLCIIRTNTLDVSRRSDVADPHRTNQPMPHEAKIPPTASFFPGSGPSYARVGGYTCRWTHVSGLYSCCAHGRCMRVSCFERRCMGR